MCSDFPRARVRVCVEGNLSLGCALPSHLLHPFFFFHICLGILVFLFACNFMTVQLSLTILVVFNGLATSSRKTF